MQDNNQNSEGITQKNDIDPLDRPRAIGGVVVVRKTINPWGSETYETTITMFFSSGTSPFVAPNNMTINGRAVVLSSLDLLEISDSESYTGNVIHIYNDKSDLFNLVNGKAQCHIRYGSAITGPFEECYFNIKTMNIQLSA